MTRRIVSASDEFFKLRDYHGLNSEYVATKLIARITPVAAGISFLPGSAFYLASLELALITQVARIYGVNPADLNKRMILAKLGLQYGVTRGARFAAEAFQVVPLIGNVAKGVVGGGVVYLIGHAIIGYFEKNYPGRSYISHSVEKEHERIRRAAARRVKAA